MGLQDLRANYTEQRGMFPSLALGKASALGLAMLLCCPDHADTRTSGTHSGSLCLQRLAPIFTQDCISFPPYVSL